MKATFPPLSSRFAQHGTGAAPPRDRIRSIARLASSFGHADGREAEVHQFWRDLLEGRWHLVDYFEQDSARYLIVDERPADARSNLSDVERLVVQLAARGVANKAIALDLRMSASSVATHLRRALSKLGSWSRSELCMVHAVLFGMPGHGIATDRTLRIAELVWSNDRIKVISTPGSGRVAHLTEAEREVAWSALSGMSNSDIALLRKRSPRTIANQMASAFRKLGVTSRAELAAALFSTVRNGYDR